MHVILSFIAGCLMRWGVQGRSIIIYPFAGRRK